jgi:hypothetical protein
MMKEQVKRRRSKWDRPEEEKPSFFKELKEGIQKHWPAVLGVIAGFFLFLFLCWLITREYTGDVSGKVTYGGQPVPWGRVTFVSQGGRHKAVSAAIKNGAYQIKNCPRGLVKISVESMKAPKITMPPSDPGGITKGFKIPAPADVPPPEVVGQHLVIPPEYGNADTSNQTFKVGWGSQTHDIDLPRR